MNAEQAAAQMVADARAFYEFGWLLGTSGNLSVRLDADTFLITASGNDKGRLRPEYFLVCGLDGKPTDPAESRRPSAETLLHCEIYDHFADAGAVYHVHEPYAALCSDRDEAAGETVVRDVEMIKGLDIWDEDAAAIPIVENFRDIPQLAQATRARLGDSRVPAINILRHGYYAWGVNAFAAKRHVETLAYLFRYSWERSQSQR